MDGPADLAEVAANLARVRERIERARERAGAAPDVQLVAVSKTVPLPRVAAACAAGQWDLGENRVQDALARVEQLPPHLAALGLPADMARWHLIGPIQSNKARRAVGPFVLLHAVDGWPLACKLDAVAGERAGRQAILLEVNLTREPQKHGVAPEAAAELAARIAAECRHLDLQGLMTMARFGAGEAELRATFGGLRRLAEACRPASGLPLPHLSMGMSDDFETAVAEGATIVRIGSAIFGPRA